MSPRRRRRTNTWTQIGVSVCVLLLPLILAVAVLAPRPLHEAGYAPEASGPVEETSAPLPITEGSFRPPTPSFQPSVVDCNQFVDRFAAAFDRAEEIGGPLPPIPDEQSLPAERAASDRPVLAAPEAFFHHRHFRTGENRDIAAHHAHRISKQRPSQSRNDYSQRPIHRICPAERKQPVNRVDIRNNVRGAVGAIPVMRLTEVFH